ncbi:ectonucleoside triphosphate diphosphohydrolase 1-like isoform X3 [Hetaerina americana]|uniref:ectonucleoside triphosphate diphosphohydrolase 1-like isoform X3 n=1 Tax=Hetaerina americana TaxID=62018 RepID=UPI003A7F44BC
MSITVVIECRSSGPVGGYHEQRVYYTDTVGSLIDNYCAFKGIRRDPGYVLIAKDNLLRESIKTLGEAGFKDGDHLCLVKRGHPSDFGINRWWLFCAICLTFGVVGLSVITILYVSNLYPPFDYGLVFDAGSSHTNMYLYTWQGDKANGTGVVRQLSQCVVEGGGIAAEFWNSPKEVQPYLKKCLDEGISNIPEHRQHSSPVYLAATAGMRLLGAVDPEAENEILGNASLLFKESPLKFGQRGARTICGEEEALYGWITVNYLSDTLTQARRLLFRAKRETLPITTIGALDMGGASTQITFEVPPPDPLPSNMSDCGDDIKTLKLFGKNYYLYSKSFLCFGVQEFKKMYYMLLLKAFSSFGYISHGLNINSSLGEFSFYNASKGVCETSWSQMGENTYPGILPKFKSSLCFQSLYQYILLKEHYKLKEEEWKKLNFSQTIDGTDVGWTLGFMINGTNVVPAEAPISSLLSLTGFIILGIFFAAFVALAAAIAAVAIQKIRVGAARPHQILQSSSDGSSQRFTYGAIDA